MRQEITRYRIPIRAPLLIIALSFLAACTTSRDVADTRQPAPATVSNLIASWPDVPRDVANTTIRTYGQPDEAGPTRLIWHDVGPWRTTIVYRDEVPHDFPKPHTDVLEQVIDYRVPPDKFDDLAHYDGSVIAERTKGTLAARCDNEAMNFLALNLANDIVEGRRTVAQARQFYTETVQAFMTGERRPYTQGFQFPVPEGGTGDPDVSTIHQR